MKITIIIVALIFSSAVSYSQGITEANLILVIDEQLVLGSIANLRIINGKGNELEASYYSGRLTFEKLDFDRIVSLDDSLTLAFDYCEKVGSKQLLYNYKLPFDKYWLTQ